MREDRGQERDGGVDERELAAFIRTSYPRVVGTVTLVCGSRALAEDAVQEALARAWERTERGLEIDSLPAWVTTVALNVARSGFRRVLAEQRARRRMADAQAPAAELGAEFMDFEVQRALADLPRRQREVTVLRYYGGLDLEEIARTTGVNVGTVKTQLHRARRAMAVALGPNNLEEVGGVVRA
jgi:RNA polymerase sigma factor (sigma-70 family)